MCRYAAQKWKISNTFIRFLCKILKSRRKNCHFRGGYDKNLRNSNKKQRSTLFRLRNSSLLQTWRIFYLENCWSSRKTRTIVVSRRFHRSIFAANVLAIIFFNNSAFTNFHNDNFSDKVYSLAARKKQQASRFWPVVFELSWNRTFCWLQWIYFQRFSV